MANIKKHDLTALKECLIFVSELVDQDTDQSHKAARSLLWATVIHVLGFSAEESDIMINAVKMSRLGEVLKGEENA